MKPSTCVLFAGSLALSGLLAESPAATDPFVRNPAEEATDPASAPKIVSICVETFSLDLADAVPLRLSELVTFGLVEIARPLAAANSPFATPTARDWRRRGYVASSDLSSFRVR